MHFCTALFHYPDSNPESLMYPYSYDTDDEELLSFCMDYSKEDAESMFKAHSKKNKEYKDVDDYMQNYYGCYQKDADGNYGNRNNPNGLYDWFEIGGRWAKILYPKISKSMMKKRQDADLKDKSKYELKEYVELRMMSPEEYCKKKNPFGKTSITLKKLDVKSTLETNKSWAGKNREMGGLFYTVICEESGIRDKEDFDELLVYWKKRGGVLTVIDYHS